MFTPRPMRLWLFLTLVVNGIITLAFLSYGIFVANELSERRLEEIQHDTRNMARSIAASAANDLLTEKFDDLENLLFQQMAIRSLREAILADAQGRIVTQVQRDEAGQTKVIYTSVAKQIATDRSEWQTEDRYTSLVPIDRGQRLGWVQVTSDLSTLGDLRRHIWIDTLISSLLTALLAGTVLLLLLRRSSRGLEEAAHFAIDMQKHNGALLPLTGGIAEIRQLQVALNEAALALNIQHHELRDAEARKGAILEASLDCLVTIDAEGFIVDFNPAAETTFGYCRNEVIGALMSDLIVPPAHRAAHNHGMRHFNATGEGPVLRQRIEITALRRDGSEFPVELTVVPFTGGGKQFFLGSIRDISEHKVLENEQKRITNLLHQTVSDLQVRQLALDVHAIVSITDLQGTITYANQKFCAVSQYSNDELIGQNHRFLKSGFHDQAFYEAMWNTISAGRVWHGELANRRKDGEIYWVASTIVPILDDHELPTGYISIRTDITAQKQAERALADAYQRELATGNAIQQSLLFGDVPEGIHGALLSTYTEPSRGIDGDFYAITRFRPDCFELLVGDVMGKGVPAALIGAGIKSSYHRVLAELLSQQVGSNMLPTPAEIINAMHRALTNRLLQLETFVTLALYRFDLATNTLTRVNAGHTPALLVREDDASIEILHGDNLPLGVLAEETYQQTTVDTRLGDGLLVYSDGITEASNSDQKEFGLERLTDILQAGRKALLPPSTLLQSVRLEVRRFTGSDILRDDQTAVMVELQPRRRGTREGISERNSPTLLVLPWRLDGLEPLRKRISEVAIQLDETDRQALILASFEAATNILRHAHPYFSDATLACRITHDGAEVSVELIYPGPNFAPPDNPQPDFSGNSEGGFGLYIIENCVDRVEYTNLAPGISRIRLVKNTVIAQDEPRS